MKNLTPAEQLARLNALRAANGQPPLTALPAAEAQPTQTTPKPAQAKRRQNNKKRNNGPKANNAKAKSANGKNAPKANNGPKAQPTYQSDRFDAFKAKQREEEEAFYGAYPEMRPRARHATSLTEEAYNDLLAEALTDRDHNSRTMIKDPDGIYRQACWRHDSVMNAADVDGDLRFAPCTPNARAFGLTL